MTLMHRSTDKASGRKKVAEMVKATEGNGSGGGGSLRGLMTLNRPDHSDWEETRD